MRDLAHTYSESFYAYIDAGARASARAMIAAFGRTVPRRAESVIDIGCGRGAWLAEWAASGADSILGIDGEYVDRANLAIDPSHFIAADLSGPFDAGRRFDIVQSLEVAEHLPPDSSASFAATLAAHGDLLIFSAAVPGQGGEHHINERPLGFWKDLFAALGFRCFDCLRPALSSADGVEPWYKYNTLLYARGPALSRLSDAAIATELGPGAPVPDTSSPAWKLRRTLLRPLPEPIVTRLSRAHQRFFSTPAARG